MRRAGSRTEFEHLFHRVSKRLVIHGWIANAIGVAVVFVAIGFLLAVLFSPGKRDELGEDNWPVVLGAFAVFGVVLTVVLKRRRRDALRWLLEGREPTEREQRLTLGMPMFTSLLTASAGFSEA